MVSACDRTWASMAVSAVRMSASSSPRWATIRVTPSRRSLRNRTASRISTVTLLICASEPSSCGGRTRISASSCDSRISWLRMSLTAPVNSRWSLT
jgi:hypothetical protein